MDTGRKVGKFAVEHPRLIASLIVGITVILTILATLPSIWPRTFTSLNPLKIDTDPENMLPDEEPVRIFHDRMKEIMSLNDMIVVGIVNPEDEKNGVFTPESLKKIYALTEFSRGLRWRDPENPAQFSGVVEQDMIAPSMVDNVESSGGGFVRFEWLMSQPPETLEEAQAVKRKALEIPFLKGTLVSEDGKAIALYLPITTKDVTYRIYSALQQKIENPSHLFPSEVGSFNALLDQLATASEGQGPAQIRDIWQQLSSKTQEKLLDVRTEVDEWQGVISRYERAAQQGNAPAELKQRAQVLLERRKEAMDAFVADLNTWMKQKSNGAWLAPYESMRQSLGDEGRELLAKSDTLNEREQYRLKRLWLEAALPDKIIKSHVDRIEGDEDFHITGLPVAEDTFGVLMFKQMAISAPLAMLIIFVLMWFFFRSALVILPAIWDALIATLATMSLLVITGNTVHIMSSMIPIFIVPIAVLDDVHVISEFFDRYQKTRDRKKTIQELMSGLFTPMLYTTLTTAIGFASLALAPIPPVQVFGLFVAFGVIVAWLCSILLVPAFISILPQKVLDDFGTKHASGDEDPGSKTLLGRLLQATGRGTYRRARLIIIVGAATLAISGYGISLIRVNDNPTKWFDEGHPIRIADKVLNDHFGGTYMAYLALRSDDAPRLPPMKERGSNTEDSGKQDAKEQNSGPKMPSGMNADSSQQETSGPSLPSGLNGKSGENSESGPSLPSGLDDRQKENDSRSGPALPAGLRGKKAEARAVTPPVPDETEATKPEIFKNPQTLRWIGALQHYMNTELGGLVGKSNSVTDIVKTVHRELMVGVERDGHVITEEEAMRIPDSKGAVAQSLLQFQNSHRPQDLWHFVTPDYRTGVIWLQLTSGDNRDMSQVERRVNDWLGFWAAGENEAMEMVRKDPERFRPVLRSIAEYARKSGREVTGIKQAITSSPAEAVTPLKAHMEDLDPAYELRHDWFGLTYINVVWQEKMVKGMLGALLGSFLAVFLMMTLLYRSALWGILCMAPLTVTIAMTYGLTGLIGKDYDMPVAVLSSLSLGLAVDYAIHFLTRSRMMYTDYGSWEKTAGPVFGEPARAIARNAIVVGIGFLPLLLAPLVPYQTVGLFIAAILLLAGVATMLILPATMTLLENKLFPRTQRSCTLCNRGTCIVVVVAAVALIVINLRQFFALGWTTLSWISAAVVLILGGGCIWSSWSEKSRTETFVDENSKKEDAHRE